MEKKTREDLEYFVDRSKECGYLRTISYVGEVEFTKVLDYALDFYNYYTREGVEKREAKLQSLYQASQYVNKIINSRC